MRTYRNPFSVRASEQLGDTLSFLRNFGAGVLDLLPESIWDRPLVIQSAPGGGKTSLMRLLTIESLDVVHGRRAEFPELVERLTAAGALGASGPTHLGVLLNLDRDYRSLLDLGVDTERAMASFLRLLDARILQAVVRSALEVTDESDAGRLELVPLGQRFEVDPIAEALGGFNGEAMITWAQRAERDVLQPVDSLLPVDAAAVNGGGPRSLLSLRLLSQTRLAVGGREMPWRPLVMLDDGHELGPEQRKTLLKILSDRSLQVARWYSERFEALDTDELMVGNILGRDFELLELESEARKERPRFEKVMRDVADRRARPYLLDYAGIEQPFSDLVRVDDAELLAGREEDILHDLHLRVDELANARARYAEWTSSVRDVRGYDGAVTLRALEIAIHKDLRLQQTQFVEEPLPQEAFRGQIGRVMPAARHLLARDFNLPYYAGPEVLARLGSENMEQFLRVAGAVFDQVLAEITLRRIPPRVGAAHQDRLVRRASERYWREMPTRINNGRNVRRLVAAIVELCQADTFRPTAPYSPGVTGTALLMSDRERLIDPDRRQELNGADELYEALGAAVAQNVLAVEKDYAVKNQRVMVIYLNRLICPRFKLPLGRGGFRERTLEAMCGWMVGSRRAVDDEALEVSEVEQLQL